MLFFKTCASCAKRVKRLLNKNWQIPDKTQNLISFMLWERLFSPNWQRRVTVSFLCLGVDSTFQCISHFSLHTTLPAVHFRFHSTLHLWHSPFYTHSNLHTLNSTLDSLHSTLHTPHSPAPHSPPIHTPPPRSTLHSRQWFSNIGRIYKAIVVSCFGQLFCWWPWTWLPCWISWRISLSPLFLVSLCIIRFEPSTYTSTPWPWVEVPLQQLNKKMTMESLKRLPFNQRITFPDVPSPPNFLPLHPTAQQFMNKI